MDIQGMRARADELMSQWERMRSGVGELQQKLKKVSAAVTSDDGLVTATVGPRGQVIKVEFDPRIYRHPNSKQLSATVTETIRKATAKAMAEVEELCRPLVPDAQFQAYMDHDLEGIFRQLVGKIDGLNNAKPWGTDQPGDEFNKNYLGDKAPAKTVLTEGKKAIDKLHGLGTDVASAVEGTVDTDDLISKWFPKQG